MSMDVVVGLLTLLGLVYVGWSQIDLRRSEVSSNGAEAVEFSAEAVRHMTSSLMEAIEALATRDKTIAELRARVEFLEEQDRLKTQRINDLEQMVEGLKTERRELREERDVLTAQLKEAQAQEGQPCP